MAAIRKMDFRAAEALAKEITEDARPPLRGLYLMLAGPGHPDAGKAQTVLGMLGELSIIPWLTAARARTGPDRMAALFEAFRAGKRYEESVVARLRTMLEQRGPLPPPPVRGAMEVQPPQVRECDEAYLLLRHLHIPDAPAADAREYDTSFRRAPQGERDRWIQRYTESGEFSGD